MPEPEPLSVTPIVVTVLSVHPAKVAATRLRLIQYADLFAEHSITLRSWSFLREQDLAAWFGRSHFRRVLVLLLGLARLPRVVTAVRHSQVLVVQREAVPVGPPVVELLAARGRRLVWDVDDAIWEHFDSPTVGRVPQWLRATGGKYSRLCRRADEVWAGSEVLAAWCRACNPRTQVVPTVVTVPPARPVHRPNRIAGWIGSHSTQSFVEAALPAVAAVAPPPLVTIVGAHPEVPAGLEVEIAEWSPEAEARALERIRVGLYPIDRRHPLAEGKCGLKAILYMAHGIPPVVTPTPTNARIVRDGIDGLHAETTEDWTQAVARLLEDGALWESLSLSAYNRAREDYSLQTWAPRLAARLVALAAGRS